MQDLNLSVCYQEARLQPGVARGRDVKGAGQDGSRLRVYTAWTPCKTASLQSRARILTEKGREGEPRALGLLPPALPPLLSFLSLSPSLKHHGPPRRSARAARQHRALQPQQPRHLHRVRQGDGTTRVRKTRDLSLLSVLLPVCGVAVRLCEKVEGRGAARCETLLSEKSAGWGLKREREKERERKRGNRDEWQSLEDEKSGVDSGGIGCKYS